MFSPELVAQHFVSFLHVIAIISLRKRESWWLYFKPLYSGEFPYILINISIGFWGTLVELIKLMMYFCP